MKKDFSNLPMKYCPCCGATYVYDDYKKCLWCSNKKLEITKETATELIKLSQSEGLGVDSSEYIRRHYVYDNPMFNIQLYKYRISDANRINKEFTSKENTSNKPKCPSCGSSNITKIGIINKAISTSILGLLSNKVGKQYKCNDCGSMW